MIYILGISLILAAILLSQYMSPRVGRELQSYYENFTLAGFFWEVRFSYFSKIMCPKYIGARNRKRSYVGWEVIRSESI